MKRLITLLLPALLALTACSLEDSGQRGTLQAGETMASFTVDLPNEFSGPQGYTLKIDNDKAVNEFHVLAFDSENNLADWAAQTDITGAEGSPSFNVKFKKLTIGKAYTFVVLANAGKQVDVLSVTFGSKPSYEVLMPKFIQGDGDGSDVTRIPMWGEAEVASLAANNSITEMPLLRMMAKINVSAALKDGKPFDIEEVYLYNYRPDGRIVPNKANIGTDHKATAPTLTDENRVTGPLSYDYSSGASPIYAFEADVAGSVSDPDLEEAHCLVIGATYNNGDKSYYRVNFRLKDAQDNVTYLPLLRNHSYNIKITSVNGDGYTEPKDAFKSKGVSVLEAEIIEWNNADMTDIDFDGQYMLSVTKKAWTFDSDGRSAQSADNVITIQTDWTGGWEKVSRSTWLDLKPISGNDWYIFVDPYTETTDRTGEIVIKAGRITTKITVKQTGKSADIPLQGISITQSDITLNISDTHTLPAVTFNPTDATNQNVTWSVSPATGVVTISGNTLTAIGAGPATVTVKSEYGNFTASFNVTVNPIIPTDLTIALPPSAILGMTQNTLTLTPVYTPTGSHIASWNSTNTDVATVANGVVTAHKVGTTQITATVGTVTSNICYLTVSSGTPGDLAGWAGSNIYWNGTELTFDDEKVTDHDKFQGVFFKWGSLYAMSPRNNSVIYKPADVGGSVKYQQATLAYAKVTHMTDGSGTDRNSKFLYNNTHAVSATATLGDICKFLTDLNGGSIHGKRWRMPTSNEMNAWSSAAATSGTWSIQASNANDGSFQMTHGRVLSGNRLPAAGRRGSDGAILNQGTHGFYWSASPSGAGGYAMDFGTGTVGPVSYPNIHFGFPVRCVVED